MRSLACVSVAAAIAAGCGGIDNSTFNGGANGGNGIPQDGGADPGDANFNQGDGGAGLACSRAATLVYVLSSDDDLYSFAPLDKLFHKIGHVGCATTMRPNSMAVSRDAVAFVNYVQTDAKNNDTDGAVFQVSTADASCQPTNIKLMPNWFRVGMGFSSDQPGSNAETMFLAAIGTAGGFPSGKSPGLGRLDFSAQAPAPIGPFTGGLQGQNAELTGTGDARLYSFFTTTPVQVAETDKTSGATKAPVPLTGVETPAYWAFSFWGGDFFLYTSPDPNRFPKRTSNVTHYTPADGKVDAAFMTDIGFKIVGAGVSTCAPTTTPR